MKVIRYKIAVGTNSENALIILDKEICCGSDVLAFNEAIAKKEAYNGEYIIEDDGIPEGNAPTHEQRIGELEEALELLLNGVTE